VSASPSPDSAVIILRIASHTGPAFQLDSTADNCIGRGPTSLVVLADRMASRRHAVIAYAAPTGTWSIHDLESRNGTLLDGVVVVGKASLADGQVIRIGTTELEFRTTIASDLVVASSDAGRLVRHGPLGELQGVLLTRMASSTDEARWPMLLYQSAVRLLASGSSWHIVCTTLELATEFTAATRFAWFTLSGSGVIEPVCVVPPGNGLDLLLAGAPLVEVLAGRAAWVSSATAEVAAVPVPQGSSGLAVLVAAAPPGGLREADFDVLVMLAGLAAASGIGHGKSDARGTDPLDEDDFAAIAPEEQVEGTLALTGADLAAMGVGSHGFEAPQVPAGSGSLRIDQWQRALVVEALRRAGGSVPEAATALGISRATLYRKLDAWGLTRVAAAPPPAAP
jgi:pSer/pThr/pTyr-binding forkhead associated (FHA) protein